MKKLTDNDTEFLRRMWQAGRIPRRDLSSSERRAGDRLVRAGIIMSEEAQEDLTGRSVVFDPGGNGHYLIFDYDPFRAAAAGDPSIVAQIIERAPDVLCLRPVGKDAQALFRIVR